MKQQHATEPRALGVHDAVAVSSGAAIGTVVGVAIGAALLAPVIVPIIATLLGGAIGFGTGKYTRRAAVDPARPTATEDH